VEGEKVGVLERVSGELWENRSVKSEERVKQGRER